MNNSWCKWIIKFFELSYILKEIMTCLESLFSYISLTMEYFIGVYVIFKILLLLFFKQFFLLCKIRLYSYLFRLQRILKIISSTGIVMNFWFKRLLFLLIKKVAWLLVKVTTAKIKITCSEIVFSYILSAMEYFDGI